MDGQKIISLLLDLLRVLRQLGPGPAGEERLVICNLSLMLLLDFDYIDYRSSWFYGISLATYATYAWWMPWSFGQLGLVELCPKLLIQSPHTVVMYSSLNHLSTSSLNPTTQYYTFKSAILCANSDHKCTTRFQWTPHWNPRSAQIRTGSPVAMYHRCRDSAHWCRSVEVQSL